MAISVSLQVWLDCASSISADRSIADPAAMSTPSSNATGWWLVPPDVPPADGCAYSPSSRYVRSLASH